MFDTWNCGGELSVLIDPGVIDIGTSAAPAVPPITISTSPRICVPVLARPLPMMTGESLAGIVALVTFANVGDDDSDAGSTCVPPDDAFNKHPYMLLQRCEKPEPALRIARSST